MNLGKNGAFSDIRKPPRLTRRLDLPISYNIYCGGRLLGLMLKSPWLTVIKLAYLSV